MLRSRPVKRHLSTRVRTPKALKFAVRRWTHSLCPSPTIHRDLVIDGDRNESIGFDILELNNLMPRSGELSPSARLFRVLFERDILPTLHCE